MHIEVMSLLPTKSRTLGKTLARSGSVSLLEVCLYVCNFLCMHFAYHDWTAYPRTPRCNINGRICGRFLLRHGRGEPPKVSPHGSNSQRFEAVNGADVCCGPGRQTSGLCSRILAALHTPVRCPGARGRDGQTEGCHAVLAMTSFSAYLKCVYHVHVQSFSDVVQNTLIELNLQS